MVNFLLVLLLATRIYHDIPLSEVSKTLWTHVSVRACVVSTQSESDGDVHIWLKNGNTKLLAEKTPDRPGEITIMPDDGFCGTFQGIVRYDKKHKWYEIHPLESWR
jgi:hypothetical protein